MAISDPEGRLALPWKILKRQNDRQAIREIARLAREESIELLVVGDPVNVDGRRGEASARARRFGEALAQELGLPVEWIQESLTSVEAAERLTAAGVSRHRQRQLSDAVAAQILLQEALDHRAGTA